MYPVVTATLGWRAVCTQHMLGSADCVRLSCIEQMRVHQLHHSPRSPRRSSADAEDDHRVGLRPAPIALRCLTCSVGPTYDLRWSPLGRAPSSGNVSQPRDCFFTGWQVSCSGCQRCFPWQPSMHHNSLWSPSTRCTIEAAWEERWTIILTTLLVLA